MMFSIVSLYRNSKLWTLHTFWDTTREKANETPMNKAIECKNANC